MHEDSRSELQDLHSRVLDEESRTQELRFEGFGVRNDDLSKAKVNFPLERDDSRVSSNGGARYKTLSPARLPIADRSPCFTIPAGMSPGTLLESPVFLTNVEAEPSPTTGTFSMPLNMDDNATSDTLSSSGDSSSNSTYDEGSSGDFEFKPRIRSYASLSGALASVGSKQQQFEPSLQDQSQCQTSASCLIRPEKTEVSLHELTLCATTPNPSIEIDTSRASAHAEVASHELQQEQGSNNGIQVSEISNRQKAPLVAVENFTEDGYNWRKYGQKHVKGSEFPRSYYKCTHPNCQMKKQLERSHDGQIIDVTYKGRHDHPKPQPSRRLAAGVVLSYQGEERPYEFSSLGSVEDKLSNAHGPTSHNIDQNGTLELSPVSASDDDIEGIGRQSNNVGDHVVVDDKSESKRRKIDDCSVDVIQVGKPREPRVVVQTLSEVDILDDGYRWRKYGQKVVKGNPNPRSYYKCTNTGCPVRKHVERAPHDPKAVITTYEGKHNHDVPALRTSCHDTAAPVIVSDVSSLNTMPGAMNVKLTFDSMLTTSRQAEECETISLDLGVGISPRQDHRDNQKQQNPKEPVQNSIISACYESPNNSMDYFGSREDNGENFCFKTANLKHSSHPYEANMGGLIMEP